MSVKNKKGTSINLNSISFSDVQEKMLYSCFEIFKDFMDKNKSFGILISLQPELKKELQELYDWWTKDRKINEEKRNEELEKRVVEGSTLNNYLSEIKKQCLDLEEIDQKQLERLIKLRKDLIDFSFLN